MEEEVKRIAIKRTEGRILSVNLNNSTITFSKDRTESMKDVMELKETGISTGFCHYKYKHKDSLVNAIVNNLQVELLINRVAIFKDGKRIKTRDVLMELSCKK